MTHKPLGRKAYGSIPHLPGSKLGPGDHHIHEGQAKILLEKPRKGDRIIVQVKLDGSNVAVAKLQDHRIVALSRSGYLAGTSPHLQHRLFEGWVYSQEDVFQERLQPGEWISGEWMLQTHSIEYELNTPPFIPFDIFREGRRINYDEFISRVEGSGLSPAGQLHAGDKPFSVESLQELLWQHSDSLIQPVHPEKHEGAVWRCENKKGEVDFLAKWVRPDFTPGRHLDKTLWNSSAFKWLPKKAIDRIVGGTALSA